MCLAKEMQMTQAKGDYLVLHLSELVRVAFMAATSDSDPLRLEGLRTMQVRIDLVKPPNFKLPLSSLLTGHY